MYYDLSDPNLPVKTDRAMKNLKASVEDSLANSQKTITTKNSAGLGGLDEYNLEILFVLDMSDDSEDVLQRSVTFAKNHIKKVFFEKV